MGYERKLQRSSSRGDETAALSRGTNVNIDTNFSRGGGKGRKREREREIASANVGAQDARAAVRK